MIRFFLSLAVLFGLSTVAAAQFAVGGVYVDAAGVVRQANRDAVVAPPPIPAENDDVSRSSPRRVVSLARLEASLGNGRSAGVQSALAGLSRIDEVHLLEDDVLLVGPAEGWRMQPNGLLVGVRSNEPVLLLEDLLVALRMAFDEGPRSSAFGCSIDPTAEGAARMAAVTRRIGPGVNAFQVAKAMEQAMGPQQVRVFGVAADSPFALGLVAADVELKRVAMGFDPTGVRAVPSYVDLVARTRVRGQTQNRFWFVAHYDEIRASPDRRAFVLGGPGIRLLGSPHVAVGGDAAGVAKPSSPAGRFAAAFNEHLDRLAAAHPEFASLRNQVALTVAAELAVQPHLAEVVAESDRGFWAPTLLLDATQLPVRTTRPPKFVPSTAGLARTRGGQPMIHVSGGVQVSPAAVVRGAKPGVVRGLEPPVRPDAATVWWWDAKSGQSRPKASSSAR